MMNKHFANLAIPESSDKSLTRAISYSDLSSHRFYFQQSENSNGLIKQYSFEQIFDKESNLSLRRVNVSTTVTAPQKNSLTSWRPSINRFDSVENPGWYKNIDKKPEKKYNDISEKSIPMIELDGLRISDEPSINKSNIFSQNNMRFNSSKVSNNSQEIVNIFPSKLKIEKKKLKEKESQVEKFESIIAKKSSSITGKKRKIFLKICFFCLIIIAAIITSSLISDLTAKPFDITNSSIELRENIYGQNEAIESIIKNLKINTESFTVLTLVGGTGVGKTLTASIIKKNFPFKQNIFEYYSPLDGPFPPSFNSLSFLHCNLILLENLKNNDIPDLINFIKFWQEQKDKPCAMVLAILNPEEINSRLEKILDLKQSQINLQKYFDNANVKSEIIVYKQLDEKTLDKCIIKEAIENKINLTFQKLQEVRMHLLLSRSGCKGAHAKVVLVA